MFAFELLFVFKFVRLKSFYLILYRILIIIFCLSCFYILIVFYVSYCFLLLFRFMLFSGPIRAQTTSAHFNLPTAIRPNRNQRSSLACKPNRSLPYAWPTSLFLAWLSSFSTQLHGSYACKAVTPYACSTSPT